MNYIDDSWLFSDEFHLTLSYSVFENFNKPEQPAISDWQNMLLMGGEMG